MFNVGGLFGRFFVADTCNEDVKNVVGGTIVMIFESVRFL
jgi:hypothetical protein